MWVYIGDYIQEYNITIYQGLYWGYWGPLIFLVWGSGLGLRIWEIYRPYGCYMDSFRNEGPARVPLSITGGVALGPGFFLK